MSCAVWHVRSGWIPDAQVNCPPAELLNTTEIVVDEASAIASLGLSFNDIDYWTRPVVFTL